MVSAMEHIASDSSGIITQGMIDTMNQWYSAQLSEKVNRGMRQKAAQCKYTGGPLSFGSTIDEDKYYVLDPITSPIVKEIFERYAAGENGTEIMKDLNERGIKTTKGMPFTKNSLRTILRNERYKGVYVYADIKIPDKKLSGKRFPIEHTCFEGNYDTPYITDYINVFKDPRLDD